MTTEDDNAEMDEGGAPEPHLAPYPRARRRGRRIAAGVAAAGVIGLGGLWLARMPISDYFLASEFAARGVVASYTVAKIGPRTQRLENVVIGDPARPDLTAAWVELDLGYEGFTPAVRAVRASGVRLRGSWREGRFSLGVLDRLLASQSSSGAAGLPDIDLTLVDGRATFNTDYGPIGVVLSGTGPLYGGFNGRGAIASPQLAFGDCRLARPLGDLAVTTSSGRLSLKGPLRPREMACAGSGLLLTTPDLGVDLRLARAFDGVSGALTLASPALQATAGHVARPAALITFDGPFAKLAGSIALSAESFRTAQVMGAGVRFGGPFAMRAEAGDSALSLSATLIANDVSPAGQGQMAALIRGAASTPLEPLARRLSAALLDAGKRNRVRVAGKLQWTGAGGALDIERGRLVAENGARFDLKGPARLLVDQARGRWEAEGSLHGGGGGLPDLSLMARRSQDGALAATLDMEPYAAGDARLALGTATLALAPDGSGHVRANATVDGPLPGGHVKGLELPVDLRLLKGGGFALAGNCTDVRWTSLALSSVQLDPATLKLCADQGAPLLASDERGLRGGVVLASLALNGRVGESPLVLRAGSARIGLAGLRFALADLAVRLGDASAPTMLDASRIEGGARGAGFAGSLSGAHARIGAVPLDMSGIAGGWSFSGGRLALSGRMAVSDTAADPRFFPLVVPDARLALVNGRIGAEGTLRHPSRDRALATVRIAHDLGSGKGSALFDIGQLAFGPSLQPDEITPLALGIIANVAGVVTGDGRIDWTGAGVTSTGTFETENARFAAAFGPVEGFSTRIHFDDLLGMRTAPGQVMRARSVNPGIEVRDGVIHYALLSADQARIEGGHWPFAGGDLDLLPATVELDSRKARHFAFRVTGLDAGAFINTLELKDISATGTYDGLLPMIFDERGGRIEGGILVARQPGLAPLIVEDAAKLTVPCDPAKTAGTLSYVGALSNEQLGAFGTLAFEALKNLRYRCLTILMDGALDGEFVTRVAINGVNQGTPAAASSMFARPFLGLPFLFNVRVEAPFRGLLNTAQSFIDPSNLVRESLGAQYQTVLDAGAGGAAGGAAKPGLAVQPQESDKSLMKEQK